MTTAAEAMVAATARLRAAGVSDPARDARVLLAHAARIEAARVTLIAPEDLDPDIEERFEQLISLRAVRVPVSHLLGERDFYGRRFKISGDVLDPRPETETLVEAALAHPFQRVLDLGTGSGAILISLLAENPQATGLGVDLSEAACLQAAANATLHRVQGRAQILQSDWFANVTGQFDLIVSNPPYIPAADMAHLDAEVRNHEPAMALTDGADGLNAYRAIARDAPTHMTAGARLLLEIGVGQGPAVLEILAQAGFDNLMTVPDLDRRDRVICARFGEDSRKLP